MIETGYAYRVLDKYLKEQIRTYQKIFETNTEKRSNDRERENKETIM
jgi:hypothetical protein